MYFLYNISIVVAEFFLWPIALFNKKIKLFVNGRTSVFLQLKSEIAENDKTIWIHCASLGEFEQGRPIIERLRTKYSHHKIVLTFFSPSGYEVRKDYEGADVVCYLPFDTKGNARKFIELTHPSIAIFVKYEFWPNILRELKNKNIETILVSGVFRKNQTFFKSFGSWMRKSLYTFNHFFVQELDSKELLETIKLTNVSVSGDTRFDRVYEITQQDNSLDFIEKFKGDNLVLIAGSTWNEGETMLADYINNSKPEKVKYVIAPHSINNKGIEQLKNKIKHKTVLFSEKETVDLEAADVLIIDTIGILTKIYSYADVAYVGGGFATGLHNILEPATFGVPVLIGPKYDKYNEAVALVQLGGVQVVSNQIDLESKLYSLFTNEAIRREKGKICSTYIKNNVGATEMIMGYIDKEIG